MLKRKLAALLLALSACVAAGAAYADSHQQAPVIVQAADCGGEHEWGCA
ncbi:hypothetical protein HII36_18375 [Nonomuraea sp. NN258]|nr:hypothetical protein [Nonomuraea antri]NRQ33804.1 hypothetical protein [Nonomuraea antri]